MKSRSLSESWRCDRYCHIGLAIPLRPSADRAVARPPRTLGFSRKRRFTQGVNLGVYPLVELRLLQSLTGPCRRPSRPQGPRAGRHLSWGSSPLRRVSNGGSTFPELTSLRTLRSQGFSPSQRVAPRHTFRPCFMPVASMGFHPSERSPLEEPCHLSAAGAFLTFAASVQRHGPWACHTKRTKSAVCFRPVRDTLVGIPRAFRRRAVGDGHEDLQAGKPAFRSGVAGALRCVSETRGSSGRSRALRANRRANRGGVVSSGRGVKPKPHGRPERVGHHADSRTGLAQRPVPKHRPKRRALPAGTGPGLPVLEPDPGRSRGRGRGVTDQPSGDRAGWAGVRHRTEVRKHPPASPARQPCGLDEPFRGRTWAETHERPRESPSNRRVTPLVEVPCLRRTEVRHRTGRSEAPVSKKPRRTVSLRSPGPKPRGRCERRRLACWRLASRSGCLAHTEVRPWKPGQGRVSVRGPRKPSRELRADRSPLAARRAQRRAMRRQPIRLEGANRAEARPRRPAG